VFASPAVHASANFALVDLDPALQLGLLARDKVTPDPGQGESGELCLVVHDRAALQDLHRGWVAKGIRILQEPQEMPFGGRHFVALDPDGHRLRVATPDKLPAL
jgi:uncharacterized glyoxalase superfamily protein PhnB